MFTTSKVTRAAIVILALGIALPVTASAHPHHRMLDGSTGHDATLAQAALLREMQAARHNWPPGNYLPRNAQ
jgi:hypothetical protein